MQQELDKFGVASLHGIVQRRQTSRSDGKCRLRALDLAANQLTIGSVDDLCSLLAALPSLQELDISRNQLAAAKAVARAATTLSPLSALEAVPAVLGNLPASIRTRSKSKDLLIAVLTNGQLCELRVEPELFEPKEATQLAQKLARNREHVRLTRDHTELGADAPPSQGGKAARSGGLPFSRRQRRAPSEPEPLIGVIFSNPLAYTDGGGQVHAAPNA